MKYEFYPNLQEELEKGNAQKIYILTGERGLGKHFALYKSEEALRHSQSTYNILSIQPDEFGFSLWPIEKALQENNPDLTNSFQVQKDGLNYVDQLFKELIRLCSGTKRTIIFLYHIHLFNNDLWNFLVKVLCLLSNPYRRFNVCVCCCLHTNDAIQKEDSQPKHSYSQMIQLFSRFSRNTHYLYFQPWSRDALHFYLHTKLFQGRLTITLEQENLLLDAAMGNPTNLLNLTEYLKSKGILYYSDDRYFCKDFDGFVLLSCGYVPITEQYKQLDPPLRDILRGSSIIGAEFESKLLSNPLEFVDVNDKLRRLLTICRIVRQKVDDIYEFESVFSRLSIRGYVSRDECVLWNARLGEYFWGVSQRQDIEGDTMASLNSLKKSAFYFDEAHNYAKAAQLYERLALKLMAIMQYSDAIWVIQRLRKLCQTIPGLTTAEFLARTWRLEGDCYRYQSNFPKAISAYEIYLNSSHLSKLERMDAACDQSTVLYESGEIQRPLEILRKLQSELEKETDAQAAQIMVRTLSSLSAIEETLCDSQHEYHFNAALSIAKKYSMNNEYYALLRKSLIVHKGFYGISLMESAHNYYEKTGNQKELAKCLCNIAAELLLHGDLEKAKAYYQRGLDLMASYGDEKVYVPINGLGDYWCLKGDFDHASELFEQAYREEYDAFTRISILLNQATAYRKLGLYDNASARIEQAECISNSGEALSYAILLPHLLISRALLLYDIGKLDDAYQLFMRYIHEDPRFGRRRLAIAAQYIKKICVQLSIAIPEGIDALSQASSPADERFARFGITLIRFSITD